jgi:hypothetical protein
MLRHDIGSDLPGSDAGLDLNTYQTWRLTLAVVINRHPEEQLEPRPHSEEHLDLVAELVDRSSTR